MMIRKHQQCEHAAVVDRRRLNLLCVAPPLVPATCGRGQGGHVVQVTDEVSTLIPVDVLGIRIITMNYFMWGGTQQLQPVMIHNGCMLTLVAYLDHHLTDEMLLIST